MDRFLNIDWNPRLEDLIDNTFIDEDRLEKESVMHRIMTGNFIDPFKNIEDDYKDIQTDVKQDVVSDLNEEIKKEKKVTKGECESKETKQLRCYVPGIVKPIFKFPKQSILNKEKQAMCLRVLLRFSGSDKPKLTQIDREELQKYMDLQQIISKEQDEFLKFAKSKWHERSFKISCENYINLRWKSKLQYIYKLPRYYAEVTSIPFGTDKNVEIKCTSICLQIGIIPKIVLPTFIKPCMLLVNSKQLKTRFPPKTNVSNESSISFKLPVSEDVNCQKLAESNNVDLVISSSGLNCLVNNMVPNYSNSWILPIVIKRHNDKNVIYIDKPAPPTAKTIPEKNTWVYKYILKYFFIGSKRLTSKSDIKEEHNDNIFFDVTSEELLKLEEKYETASTQVNNESSSILPEKSQNSEEILKHENVKGDANSLKDVFDCKGDLHTTSNFCNTSTTGQGKENKASTVIEDNVSYKLFTIGPKLSEQNELMKNVIKEYRILVRTKTDGFEVLKDNVQRPLLLIPKLEHQVDLGAESVTLEEAVKQWISLISRPDTSLARVRISAKTSEILQIEHRTAMSISNEIKRLYNIKVDDSLIILHNIVQDLANKSPGRYIMRHIVKNAFAVVYKAVESPGKNIFDMHTVYSEQYHTLPNPPWVPLDKTVVTPMFKCFERMPAMFFPSNKKAFPYKKKCINTKVQKNTKTGIVRRSSRNKKKKIIHD